MLSSLFVALGGLIAVSFSCGDHDCYGPINRVHHVRQVKRMQPGAPNATYGPKKPLEWGQVNFLHTTDTHGWLEGHLKEKNYGADWGDFVTFSRHMKQRARHMGVDLLLVDTGDLHDGTGLSDATKPDGAKSMPIFDEIHYDLLTIGNHELYVSEVAYYMFNNYAKKWGDRYVTSNVKIWNRKSGTYEYPGVTHRYFTTDMGLRVMAFGVLFDFGGNSNASQVIKARDMIKQSWFINAITSKNPVDMFIVLGHNPVRPTDKISTFQVVFDAIRAEHPTTPIQLLGGHSHIRDFAVYDANAVGIESGRYCETLGWMSMSGFDASNSGFRGAKNPLGVKNPWRPAKVDAQSPFLYSRRYLDWNRKTFIYHTQQDHNQEKSSASSSFDVHSGQCVTGEISAVREELRLGTVYGCAPQDYCFDCAPFTDKNKNIFPGVIIPAVSAVVLNETRKDNARMILGNTGFVRFDIHKGPFTYDDNFIVSPFRDVFMYIGDVPFDKAAKVIDQLNKGVVNKRSMSMRVPDDECTNPTLGYLSRRDLRHSRGVIRRQDTIVPGYTTKDDWGTDGDDTEHSAIPSYPIPGYWEARASFPQDGSTPTKVDLIFFDFIGKQILRSLGAGYTADMVQPYLNSTFSSQDVLLPFQSLIGL
ncbi:hypothetical protein E4U21_002325 [Claviceps maximensis]|nr:hypothetical protein E4U21_002325 [Claviceps maximensis]